MLLLSLLIFLILTFFQPQDFLPGVKGMPLVYYVMLFTGFLWVAKISSKQKKINFGALVQNRLMIAFWLIIAVSTINLRWWQYTQDQILNWGKVIIIYFLMVDIIDNNQKLLQALWIIVLSMFLTAVIGILQYYQIDLTGQTTFEGRISGVGIFGTNQLAYALGYCLPLVYALFRLTKSFFQRIFLIAVSLAYLYCIFLTQSRGGLICLIMVFVLAIGKFKKQAIFRFGSYIVGIILFMIFIKFAPRFSSTLEYQNDGSALGRINAWAEGLIAFKNSPLWGIGKGQFVENFRIAPHNSFIETLTELGFFGLFIWVGLFYYSFLGLKKIVVDTKRNNYSFVVSSALQVSLIAYLIGSYFSSSAFYIPLYILFALVVILQKLHPALYESNLRLPHIIKITVISVAIVVFIHIVVLIS